MLVNCAGFGLFGAVEDVSTEDARRQMEVNLIGSAEMCKAVLPFMRNRRKGVIVNVASAGDRFCLPFGAWYHASKYAIAGLSEALRLEVRDFGIDVVLVEPGAIATDWGKVTADNLRSISGKGHYGKRAREFASFLEKYYVEKSFFTKPQKMAKAILNEIGSEKPRYRVLTGFGAKPAAFFKAILGQKEFYKAESALLNLFVYRK